MSPQIEPHEDKGKLKPAFEGDPAGLFALINGRDGPFAHPDEPIGVDPAVVDGKQPFELVGDGGKKLFPNFHEGVSYILDQARRHDYPPEFVRGLELLASTIESDARIVGLLPDSALAKLRQSIDLLVAGERAGGVSEGAVQKLLQDGLAALDRTRLLGSLNPHLGDPLGLIGALNGKDGPLGSGDPHLLLPPHGGNPPVVGSNANVDFTDYRKGLAALVAIARTYRYPEPLLQGILQLSDVIIEGNATPGQLPPHYIERVRAAIATILEGQRFAGVSPEELDRIRLNVERTLVALAQLTPVTGGPSISDTPVHGNGNGNGPVQTDGGSDAIQTAAHVARLAPTFAPDSSARFLQQLFGGQNPGVIVTPQRIEAIRLAASLYTPAQIEAAHLPGPIVAQILAANRPGYALPGHVPLVPVVPGVGPLLRR